MVKRTTTNKEEVEVTPFDVQWPEQLAEIKPLFTVQLTKRGYHAVVWHDPERVELYNATPGYRRDAYIIEYYDAQGVFRDRDGADTLQCVKRTLGTKARELAVKRRKRVATDIAEQED